MARQFLTEPQYLGLPIGAGRHGLWISGDSLKPRTTNGASLITTELVTNDRMIRGMAFNSSVGQGAQFSLPAFKSWNLGTITAKFYVSHPSTVTNFGMRFGLRGVAVSTNEALDAAFGTAQEVTITGGTTDRLYISSETAAITLAGSPAIDDLLTFEVYRDPGNAADTMLVDARLEGLLLFLTTLANTDV